MKFDSIILCGKKYDADTWVGAFALIHEASFEHLCESFKYLHPIRKSKLFTFNVSKNYYIHEVFRYIRLVHADTFHSVFPLLM